MVFVRSRPLAVTLNGRPNGRIMALAMVAVTASEATICVTSVKIGKVRRSVTQVP
ncbi:hypothetical protein D9M73_267200 [compost metagenome]